MAVVCLERKCTGASNNVAKPLVTIGTGSKAALQQTIDDWNKAVTGDGDVEYGRRTGLKPLKALFYAYHNQATNLGAIGGLTINVDGQVLDAFDTPIDGLYTAGLNAGGWIGPYYPGSGTAISGIIHQGRKAAKTLVKMNE